MLEPSVLIVTGDGLNCELETAQAFKMAGADPCPVHITDLLDGEKHLGDYQALAFIGGFSNGDHLGAGKVQAGRFRHRLEADLSRVIETGKPILGICNGFQTLVKLGILPGNRTKSGGATPEPFRQQATIMANVSGRFEDRWVSLLVDKTSPCIWTSGIERIFLPVRHGEGRFYCRDPQLLSSLLENGQVVLRYSRPDFSGPCREYPYNPNGSQEAVAGICDPSGTIFGLMPHPEAYLSPYNHPSWTRKTALGQALPREGQGLAIFRQAVAYMREL